jgi:4-hydroxy-tetrahydrodipicolinate synthase
MKNIFEGTGTALVTPMDAKGDIDTAALKKLVRYQIDNNTDFLVVQGTTGESPVLSKDEKQKCLDVVAEENNGELPIVFGIGGNDTRAICSSFSAYDLSAVDGILSVSPAYNKPTQDGIYLHFKAVSEHSELPIIAYNVPGRTSSNMSAETTLSLADECENIVAVKEASGDLGQIMEIIKNRPEGFAVLSGDDALTLAIIALGGSGVISVVSNAYPKTFNTMVHAALKDELETARVNHYKLTTVTDMLFKEGNPAGVKEALKHIGIMDNYLRLPLIPVSEMLSREIAEETNLIMD